MGADSPVSLEAGTSGLAGPPPGTASGALPAAVTGSAVRKSAAHPAVTPPFIRASLPGRGVVALTGEEELRAALADPAACVWVDFDGRSRESDAILERVFGFHPLAIEDVYHDFHRPKVEDYERYLYVIVQCLALERDWHLEQVELIELDLFLGKNFVVSHHAGRIPAVEATRIAVDKDGLPLSKGAVFMAHGLLDRIVDQFLPLPRCMADEIEELEVKVLADPSPALLERILELTRTVQLQKRMGQLQRTILHRMALAEFDEIPAEAAPFLRDVDEHFSNFVESLEGRRDELQNLFNAFHLLSSYRMNQAMRVLTGMSTIMLPLSFVAGIYGMNFKHMPELEWTWGYPFALGIMGLVGASMYFFFRTRHLL